MINHILGLVVCWMLGIIPGTLLGICIEQHFGKSQRTTSDFTADPTEPGTFLHSDGTWGAMHYFLRSDGQSNSFLKADGVSRFIDLDEVVNGPASHQEPKQP